MASTYTLPVQNLIDHLGRLPGIGPRSAQRIAFHLLKLPTEDVERLAAAISEAKARVRFCSKCFNFADDELCPICADPRRDGSVICVVEERCTRYTTCIEVRQICYLRRKMHQAL